MDQLEKIIRSIREDAYEDGRNGAGQPHSIDNDKRAIKKLIKELVAEAKRESHKSGYIQAIYDFSCYYMDASIPAQRNLIMPHIAIELTENYKYPQNLLKALEEV